MAMDAQGMANAIKDAMDNEVQALNGDMSKASSSAFASAFDNALKTYIEDNCEITYSWVGVSPPPGSTPDPVTTFKATVSYPTFQIGNPPDFPGWCILLQAAILTAVITPEPTTPPFTLGQLAFLLNTPLVMTQSGEAEDYVKALEDVCSQIITWMKTLLNVIPVPGFHGPYNASPGAIMTKIE